MPSSCLALLLALVSSCTLPGTPLTIRVSVLPRADLCVQVATHAPLCVSTLTARLRAHALL